MFTRRWIIVIGTGTMGIISTNMVRTIRRVNRIPTGTGTNRWSTRTRTTRISITGTVTVEKAEKPPSATFTESYPQGVHSQLRGIGPI